MAGPIKTIGKILGLISKTVDMGNDVADAGKAYTNNIKEQAEEDCSLKQEINKAKNDMKRIKAKAKIEKLNSKTEDKEA